MSETPTGRVELTDAEAKVLTKAAKLLREAKRYWQDQPNAAAARSQANRLFAGVVAARVQEYAEKFESLSDRAKKAAKELGGKNDRLAAELAAANARCAELEAENEAKQEAVWGLIAQVADQHVCAECADCLHDGNKCCGCYDNACCRTAALQATLDRVTAVLSTPDGKREWHNQGRSGECDVVDVSRVRAALTPEGEETCVDG